MGAKRGFGWLEQPGCGCQMVRSWRRHVTWIHPASSEWFRLLVLPWCGLGGVLSWPILGPSVPIEHYLNVERLLMSTPAGSIMSVGSKIRQFWRKGGGIQPFSSKLDLIKYPSVSFTWLSSFFSATLLLQMWSECVREWRKPPTSPPSPTERWPRGTSTWWTCLGSWWRSRCGGRRWGHLSRCPVETSRWTC